MVYVIQVLMTACERDQDGTGLVLLQQNQTSSVLIPKHVEFYFKNKFEKLVHLVCFIIRIYHDARPPERQNRYSCLISIKLGFSRHIFEKYANIDFRENLSRWRRVIPCRQTDGWRHRHGEANSSFKPILVRT